MEVIKGLLGLDRSKYRVGKLVHKTAAGKWLVRVDGRTQIVDVVSEEPVKDGGRIVVKDNVAIGAYK